MSFKPRFSKSDSLKLALVCAFPVHFWAILMVFKEAETWLTKRSLVYGLGASGYLLGLALLESLLLFGFVYLLSFLFPKRWSTPAALAAGGMLALTLTWWSIANQLYFMWQQSPSRFSEWLHLWAYYRHTLAYVLLILVVTASFALPLITIPRSEKARSAALALMDKLTLLAPLYLLFDVVTFIFAAIRNLA